MSEIDIGIERDHSVVQRIAIGNWPAKTKACGKDTPSTRMLATRSPHPTASGLSTKYSLSCSVTVEVIASSPSLDERNPPVSSVVSRDGLSCSPTLLAALF